MPEHPVRHALALLALCGATLALAGCPGGEFKRRSRGNARIAVSKQGRTNTIVSVTSLTRRPTNAFVPFERDLRPPFRIETVTGMFNARRRRGILDQAIFGMELDPPNPSFPLTQFYGISVQPLASGVFVFSASHKSTPGRHDTVQFPAGTDLVDLAIEHDGDTIRFFTRVHGDEAWTTLGTVSPVGDPFPVRPSLGLFQAKKPGQIGYDDFRIVSNGPRPDSLLAEEELVEDVWEVLDALTDAAHVLDGSTPDVQGARDGIGSLDAEIVRIIEALDALAGADKRRPRVGPAAAARKMRQSRRSCAAALRQLDVILARAKRRRATPQSAARLLRAATGHGFRAVVAIRGGLLDQ